MTKNKKLFKYTMLAKNEGFGPSWVDIIIFAKEEGEAIKKAKSTIKRGVYIITKIEEITKKI
jgi:hypothetical protein